MTVSPFKFLDAYDAGDRDRFFGREREVEALYALLLRDDLVLVYGPSGTGKTSLIQCGLASKFRDVDRLLIPVRRRDDLNASLRAALDRVARTPIPAGMPIRRAVESIFLDRLRPVHLIFDQFEELLLMGSEDEQREFFENLRALMSVPGTCKVVISMREEYFALLSRFEEVVPQLLASRLRIEPMTRSGLVEVVAGTAAAYGIALEHGEKTAERIAGRLGADPRGSFQLPYLQVYLDRLHRTAAAAGEPIVFTDALVDATGGLDDVMARFLDEQIAAVQAALAGSPTDSAQRFLERFVTAEGTRRPVTRAEIEAGVADLPAEAARTALARFERGRILRCDEEGGCELAHDSLARFVDDRRGAERKALARTAKLVRDRLADSAGDKDAWLTEGQLALVRPLLPHLDLTAAETAFVEESRRRRRRGRRIAWGVAATVIGALSLLSLFAWRSAEEARRSEQRAQATIASAEKGINTLTRVIHMQLRVLPQTEAISTEMMTLAGELNGELVAGSASADARKRFWISISDGDQSYDDEDAELAQMAYEGAVFDAERVLEDSPDDATWRTNLVFALQRAARDGLSGKGKARETLMRAAGEAAQLERERPGDTKRRQLHASVLTDLAWHETDMGLAGRTRALYAEAERRYLTLLRGAAPPLDVLSDYAAFKGNRAYSALTSAQSGTATPAERARAIAAARADFVDSRAQYQRVLDRQSINVRARHNVARTYSNEAALEQLAGKADRARELCRAGVAQLQQIIDLDPRGPGEDLETALARKDRDTLSECHGLGLG